MTNYLAIDIGAESGRAMLGRLEGGKLTLREVHRFPNGPMRQADGLHWDAPRLFDEIKTGIRLALQAAGGEPIAALGIDTWGVDYALLDEHGALLGNPYHYRHARTDGMLERAFERVGREAIFEATGIQFMQLNTLYQLLAEREQNPAALERAHTLLTMPDLFNYWLTGVQACEFSNATTTQCYDPRAGDWARALLRRLDLPERIFPRIVPPGTVLGGLLPQVGALTPSPSPGAGRGGQAGGLVDPLPTLPLRNSLREGFARRGHIDPLPTSPRRGGKVGIQVIAPACHDTGSAVAGVPAANADFAYISSGTWSLMGAEVRQPVINAAALAGNFTNEGGVGGTFRFLRNITGMWLMQECRRAWREAGQDYSYDDLTAQAAQAPALRALINPDAPQFLKPGDYPRLIQDFCRQTGQAVPETVGEITRCVLESLALKYRQTFEQLEAILGRRLEPVHIVGGGSRNALLNQFTADCLGRTVLAGPVEATATGNLLVQALALGELGSLAEARAVVRRSFAVTEFTPGAQSAWDAAYQRAREMWGKGM